MQIIDYKTEVMVKRSGKWVEIASRELVPGDVLKIKTDCRLPCDVVTIKGGQSCISEIEFLKFSFDQEAFQE